MRVSILGSGDLNKTVKYATLSEFKLKNLISEIGNLKYHKKYFKNETKLLVFKNTISQRLPKEVENEIKPIYIKSIEELKKFLG